jgi:hypothetical protein
MIKAGVKYNGKVASGSTLIESQTGTLGYQVMLECEDGATSYTIWLTERNKERAERAFRALGISSDMLRDQAYLDYKLSQEIEGNEVSFGTKEETYQGNTTIKVSWIGKKSEAKLSISAARFFGATDQNTAQVSPMVNDGPITDDDIPF